MARPKTKEALLIEATTQFSTLLSLLDEMTQETILQEFDWSNQNIGKEAHWQRDKNVKDVLVHLYEWHQLLLNWVETNTKGIETSFLPAPYNWRTYGEMNNLFTEKHQQTQIEEAKEMLTTSHDNVIARIDLFSNDELFNKKYFTWTGSTTLGSYCVSATSSHYQWAIKKIKKHQKKMM